MNNGTAHCEDERLRHQRERDANWDRMVDDSNRGHAARVLVVAEVRRAEAEAVRSRETRLVMIEERLAELEARMKKRDDAE